MSIGLTVAEPRATAGKGLRPGAFLGTPRALAILTTFCGPVLHRGGQVDVRGVHRVLGRGDQADRRAEALALAFTLVADLAATVGKDEGRVAVEGVLEREPVLEAGRERERLERRTRRPAHLGPVQLALEVVLAGVEADQGSRLDVDGGRGGVQLLQARRAFLEYAVLGGLHRLPGERRLHAQATGVDLRVVEPGALQLVPDHGQHEAALAAVHVVRPLLGQLGQLAVVLVGLGGVEGAQRDHPAQHVVVALDQGGRVQVRHGRA